VQADPYVYPGTTVLRNLAGIQNQSELTVFEYEATWGRRLELQRDPVQGDFDLSHLCEVHHRLFQDVFEWAGQLRTVAISKGSTTFFQGNWAMVDRYTFGCLHDGPLLGGGLDYLSAAMKDGREWMSSGLHG
jgi:cell filamentation protein